MSVDLKKAMDAMDRQNKEFNALTMLTKRWQQLQQVAVVDDDYPEYRHVYEGAMKDFIDAIRKNGRIPAILLVLSLLFLGTPAHAGMVIRSDTGWGEGCMRLAVQLRLLNASAVRVSASASRASDFSFNGAKVCSGTTACTFTWLRRTMKLGENTMTVDGLAADGCGVSIVSYLDLT